MSNLWPRIEPLLARVEKPARYIGMERGSQRPEHRPDQRLAARLPRHLRDRPAQPGAPDPLRDPQRARRLRRRALLRAVARLRARAARRAVPLFSVDTHRPGGRFDVIAFNLSAELVYTNVLNCLDLAGVPVRGDDRGADHPIVLAGRALHVQPRADGRLRRRVRDRRRRGGRRRDHRGRRGVEAGRREPGAGRARARPSCTSWRRSRACTCRRCTTSSTTARTSPRCAHASPTCPRRVDKRTVADLADWPYPKQQLVPLIEVVHDRLNVEIFRGCTRGCRFCQAGMITRPVRERPEEQVRTMVRDGLRRTGYDEVALTSLSSADFSGIDRPRRRPREQPGGDAAASASRSRRCASTRSPSGSRPRSRRCAARVSPSRRRRVRGACVR